MIDIETDEDDELQHDIAQKLVAVKSGREQLESVQENLEKIEEIQQEISNWSTPVIESNNDQVKSAETKVCICIFSNHIANIFVGIIV